MNQFRSDRTTEPAWSYSPQRSSGEWAGVRNFFQRQPEWILAGALVGGALLAFLATKGRQSLAQQPPFGQGYPVQHSGTQDNEPRWRNPSARMGATEGQMKELATPSARALEAGTAGATGTAYE